MASHNNEKRREIFLAVRLLPFNQRAQYLDASCNGDDALRREVESLLENDSSDTPGFLAPTLKPEAFSPPKPADEADLKTIGPYRLLEVIGSGGMGVVYKAEQRSPIRRTVAVKVIKLGYDSHEVIARFESERQALARMDHPNIARVLDAGTDERGRPYFVMEYVPGHPITKYADENRLTIQQRLELMLQVCDAIGHAHAKAIIHRDIKAGNVLAHTTADGPRVKVIDFGVAKALTSDRLTDLTFNTASGQAIGTYESMSPEQADGSPDIDTRTDVYSLGVLLYELLSGSKPFDGAKLRQAGDDEIRRIIREDEPPRPSTRISSMGDAGTKIAAARKSEVTGLARQLKSELEWIPMMAMRKERARRYQTPQQLADDLRNYLNDAALMAGPESRIYRLKKTAKQYQGVVFAICSVMLVLIAGLATTLFMAHRATRAEFQAKQATTQAVFEKAVAADRNHQLEKKTADLLAQNYRFGVQAAQQAISAGDFDVAKKFLNDCPSSLRGWEWRYLSSEASPALSEIAFPPHTRFLAHDRTGKHVILTDDTEPNKNIYIMNSSDGTIQNTIALVESGHIGHADASQDAQRIAFNVQSNHEILRTSGVLYVWDNRSAKFILNLPVCHSYSISYDGKHAAADTSTPSKVRVYNLDTGTAITSFNIRGSFVANDFQLTDDGRYLVGKRVSRSSPTSTDITIFLVDVETGAQYELPGDLQGIQTRLIVTDKIEMPIDSDKWNIFDPQGRRIVATLEDYSQRDPFDLDNSRRVYLKDRSLMLSLEEWKAPELRGIRQPMSLCHVKAHYKDLCRDVASASIFLFYDNSVARFPLPTGDQIERLGSFLQKGGSGLSNDQTLVICQEWGNYVLRRSDSFRPVAYLGDTQSIGNFAFSTDGHRLAAHWKHSFSNIFARRDGSHIMKNDRLDIFSTNDFSLLSSIMLSGWEKSPLLNCLNENGTRAVISAKRRTDWGCLIVNVNDGSSIAAIPNENATIVGIAGDSVWFLADSALHKLDISSGKIQPLAVPDHITAAALSQDRSKIALLRGDELELRHLSDMAFVKSWNVPQSSNYRVTWSDLDHRLLVECQESSCVSDPILGEAIVTIPWEDSLQSRRTVYDPKDRALIAASLPEFWQSFEQQDSAEYGDVAMANAHQFFAHLLEMGKSPGEFEKILAEEAKMSVTEKLCRERELAALNSTATSAIGELISKYGTKSASMAAYSKGPPITDDPVVNRLIFDSGHTWDWSAEENDSAWNVVKSPGGSQAEYQQALTVAADSLTLYPDLNKNTFGVAQYRVGQYEAAIATLTQSDAWNLSKENGGHSIVDDWAFLAMANYRLGKLTEAKAALQKAIELDSKSPFCQEAMRLINPPTTAPATQPSVIH